MRIIIALTIGFVLLLSGCDDDEIMLNEDGTITVSISGLSNLGSTEVYEGWIIVDGNPVSTGTFTVDDNGNLSKTTFEVNQVELDMAAAFVLSVEPAIDSDPAPSAIKILQGTFSGDNASLDLSIIGDFSASAGKYILATPTSSSTMDELSGVWFLDLSSGTPAVGLDLPDLSGVSGWTYEGWVVFPGASGPISTGTFDDPTQADANGGGAYQGVDAGPPPFPGDDFVSGSSAGITFPSDLSGGKVVISVEPVPDNSAAPFLVKPLVGDVPANALDHTTYTSERMLITGTASR